MTDTHERRRFSRIPFDAKTLLISGARRLEASLLDISLKGALLDCPEALDLPKGTRATVQLQLGDQILHLEMQLVHHHNQLLGFECTQIDLDSITHLRRLVELNLGDQALLDRELEQLIPDAAQD